MSNAPTIQSIAEDLTLANEFAAEFGYKLADDEQSIIVEAYNDDGTIAKTYTVTIEVQENK